MFDNHDQKTWESRSVIAWLWLPHVLMVLIDDNVQLAGSSRKLIINKLLETLVIKTIFVNQ